MKNELCLNRTVIYPELLLKDISITVEEGGSDLNDEKDRIRKVLYLNGSERFENVLQFT